MKLLDKLLINKPFIVSGPCSAESEIQVLETVKALSEENVQLIRAGIWKPRTRPNSFEGVGEVGLSWLKKAKEAYTLPIAVEVANASHVELALKHGVDVLWVGARTTVSPFTVQEIADAVTGLDLPVFIKNPINPDLDLWFGAIERFQKAGITQIAAIHRGFSSYGKKEFRNPPIWEIPLEFKRQCPEIPMICDPSHICGTRETLQSVSQIALDLGFEGLMIESHITPDKALSDAKQQVTPKQLGDLLKRLTPREISKPELSAGIEEFRNKINLFDEQLITILSERMKLSEKIGAFKKANNLTIFQNDRWNHIVKTRLNLAEEKGLSTQFIKEMIQLVHKESIRLQSDILNSGEKENKQS